MLLPVTAVVAAAVVVVGVAAVVAAVVVVVAVAAVVVASVAVVLVCLVELCKSSLAQFLHCGRLRLATGRGRSAR